MTLRIAQYVRPPASILLLCAILAAPAGCSGYDPPGDLDTITMRIGSRDFTLEVADTPESRRVGLMRRDDMPRYHGMLFVFPDERPRGFWMENVRFGLDIIFLDAEARVIAIAQMEPYDRSSTPSGGPIQYAIELNEGVAEAVGLQVGDQLRIPPEVQIPPS